MPYQAIASFLDMPTVGAMFASQRLRLLSRQLQRQDHTFFALAACTRAAPKSWVSLVLSDLHKVWRGSNKFEKMPDPLVDPNAWIRYIGSNPGPWHTQVSAFFSCFRPGFDFEETEPALPQVPTHTCEICSSMFASAGALATHQFSKHQKTSIARQWADGTTCQSCLLQFCSNDRLVHHLKRKKTCLDVLRGFWPSPLVTTLGVTDEEAARRTDLRSAGLIASSSTAPPVRVYGPPLPPVGHHIQAPVQANPVAAVPRVPAPT